jgi:hypothetical protein
MAYTVDAKAQFQRLIDHSDDLCRRSVGLHTQMSHLSQYISELLSASAELHAPSRAALCRPLDGGGRPPTFRVLFSSAGGRCPHFRSE